MQERTRCPKAPHAQRSCWHLQRSPPVQSEDLPPKVWLPSCFRRGAAPPRRAIARAPRRGTRRARVRTRRYPWTAHSDRFPPLTGGCFQPYFTIQRAPVVTWTSLYSRVLPPKRSQRGCAVCAVGINTTPRKKGGLSRVNPFETKAVHLKCFFSSRLFSLINSLTSKHYKRKKNSYRQRHFVDRCRKREDTHHCLRNQYRPFVRGRGRCPLICEEDEGPDS